MAINTNLNIGSHLLPTESGTAKLGDSTHKWVIDASQLSGTIEGALPSCSTSDNDKFLRVKNGKPVWDTVPSAENVSF